MDYFNFYFIKKSLKIFFKKYKIKKVFIIFILLFILLISKNFVFGYDTLQPEVTTYYTDPYLQMTYLQKERQDDFAMFCYIPYTNNTQAWQNVLKPIWDRIHSDDFNIYVTYTKNEVTIQYRIVLYYPNVLTTMSGLETSDVINQANYNVKFSKGTQILRYVVNYDRVNNTMTSYNERIDTFVVPSCTIGLFGDFFKDMYTIIYQPNSPNYSNAINNVQSSIDNLNTNIISSNGKLDNIYSSVENIESSLEDLNDTLEDTNDKLDTINDTITDDTVESSASDLPSTNVTNPTENGIDNIFTSIYNAFCVGEAQDIIFPIPFTNKNITLSPYYVRDMLNNNNAGWIYTLIQAFWGYLIGRYIVSDISKKIDKIKSGNIENVENTNIKEEML